MVQRGPRVDLGVSTCGSRARFRRGRARRRLAEAECRRSARPRRGARARAARRAAPGAARRLHHFAADELREPLGAPTPRRTARGASGAGTSRARSRSRYRSNVPSSAARGLVGPERWADGGEAVRRGPHGPEILPAARRACRRRTRRGRRGGELSGRRLVANGTRLPEPRSSTSGTPRRRATAASSRSEGRSVKPTVRKFDWCTRRTRPVSGPAAAS